MVSHETVRFSNLSQTPTSRPRPRCKNQGNPTPGDVVKRAPNKIHQFQMNKKKYSGAISASCISIVLMVFLTAPTLGMNALNSWLDTKISEKSQGQVRKRMPNKTDFRTYIGSDDEKKRAVLSKITLWKTDEYFTDGDTQNGKRKILITIDAALEDGFEVALQKLKTAQVAHWASITLTHYYAKRQSHGTIAIIRAAATPIARTLDQAAFEKAKAKSNDALPPLEPVSSASTSPASSRTPSPSRKPRRKPTKYIVLPQGYKLEGNKIYNGKKVQKVFMEHNEYKVDLFSQGTDKFGTYDDYINRRIITRGSKRCKRLVREGVIRL